MRTKYRFFNCGWCHKSVPICGDCDAGHVYCGPVCTHLARQQSIKRAKEKYQKTRQGRFKHAERQKHYRERQTTGLKIVTDHPYECEAVHDALLKNAAQTRNDCEKIVCAFCKKVLLLSIERIYHAEKSGP